MTPSGAVTLLHTFTSTEGKGENTAGPLVPSTWGRMYGINARGGAADAGTVFDADTDGRVRALHVFSGSDGGSPTSLSAGSAGLFYGTTYVGGSNDAGVLFQIDRYGNFTVLHDFDPSTGTAPNGAVVEASDGNCTVRPPTEAGGYGTG